LTINRTFYFKLTENPSQDTSLCIKPFAFFRLEDKIENIEINFVSVVTITSLGFILCHRQSSRWTSDDVTFNSGFANDNLSHYSLSCTAEELIPYNPFAFGVILTCFISRYVHSPKPTFGNWRSDLFFNAFRDYFGIDYFISPGTGYPENQFELEFQTKV
jgi:hypothetical protein